MSGTLHQLDPNDLAKALGQAQQQPMQMTTEEKFVRIDGAIEEQRFRFAEKYVNYAAALFQTLVEGTPPDEIDSDLISELVGKSISLTEKFRTESAEYMRDLMEAAPIEPKMLEMRDQIGVMLANEDAKRQENNRLAQEAHRQAVANQQAASQSLGDTNTDLPDGNNEEKTIQ